MSTVSSAEKFFKKKKRRGWRGKNSAQSEAAPPAAGSHAVCGGGAASSGRPRRRSCGSDTRSTPSVRPGTGPHWGMLRTGPRSARGGWGRAGPQGLRARLAPACPSLRSCLPPPHTTAAATHISAEMARVGCGDHPAAWTELPTSGCCWKTRSGCASGRPGRAGVAVAVPGGTRGCGQCPTGAVGERRAEIMRKDRPEPRDRRRGGRVWVSLPQGQEGSLSPDTCPWVWEPARESRGCWGHSLGSARSRSREARNVLFYDLLS